MESKGEEFVSVVVLYDSVKRVVLLQKRDSNVIGGNKWAFFGGRNEGTENPIETLAREVKEEIGLSVDVDKLKMLYEYVPKPPLFYRYVFTLPLSSDAVVHLMEGQSYGWIPYEDIEKTDLTDTTRQDLRKFLETFSNKN
ncbi:MAG: NUDIX hydrolase [Patescibacteria group bacterium]